MKWLILILFPILSSCQQPVSVVPIKEKVTVKKEELQTDKFIYGVPQGQINIVFAVDNSSHGGYLILPLKKILSHLGEIYNSSQFVNLNVNAGLVPLDGQAMGDRKSLIYLSNSNFKEYINCHLFEITNLSDVSCDISKIDKKIKFRDLNRMGILNFKNGTIAKIGSEGYMQYLLNLENFGQTLFVYLLNSQFEIITNSNIHLFSTGIRESVVFYNGISSSKNEICKDIGRNKLNLNNLITNLNYFRTKKENLFDFCESENIEDLISNKILEKTLEMSNRMVLSKHINLEKFPIIVKIAKRTLNSYEYEYDIQNREVLLKDKEGLKLGTEIQIQYLKDE